MIELTKLEVPDNLNYLSAFLTFACDKNFSYCINDPQQSHDRGKFYPLSAAKNQNALTPDQWITGLSRIEVRADLPVTMAGGEPTLYYGSNSYAAVLENQARIHTKDFNLFSFYQQDNFINQWLHR